MSNTFYIFFLFYLICKEISRLFLYHFSPSYAMMKITIKFKIQISEASGLSCT